MTKWASLERAPFWTQHEQNIKGNNFKSSQHALSHDSQQKHTWQNDIQQNYVQQNNILQI